ncbi:MATE family efflux transporter [Spongiibacter taiwanensis]|uniref:MATE family efflux transporter n=1 Tax=Spongiibacter taiwanensis TaxID=1748242 RepID=UPI002035EE23|nr:MATE family efflux transporter [Spongiibacter taiwanensis]USA42680.1 MATE family efflux transporter [Spongiibacter taiwanensis]
MSSEPVKGPDQGAVIPTFFRYVIPSTLSLLAISTASVVDGFFVGNFLGTDALAAVNLLMPYFSLLFGIALMLAVGGSVKASICIGKQEHAAASQVFSQVLLVVLALNLAVIPVALWFRDALFAGLGGDASLFPLMGEYFTILCVAMVVQLCGLVLYYFIRADNHPEVGMQALLLGAGLNIVLDALFIYVFEWGIQGAALATLSSQTVQLLYLLRYFRSGNNQLHFVWPRMDWRQLAFSAFNGFSEFINEISIGIVILVFHWIINRHSGAEGIAAFSVVNYLIFVSLMVYYGIVDAMHVLLGQNFGAGLMHRVVGFMNIAGLCIASLSVAMVIFLHVFQGGIVTFFLEEGAEQAERLTRQFVGMIWPIFLFNGFNVLICAYLTSVEKALHSSVIALSRSLVLPIALVVGMSLLLPGGQFIYAIPIAEGLTFLLALALFLAARPSQLRLQPSA